MKRVASALLACIALGNVGSAFADAGSTTRDAAPKSESTGVNDPRPFTLVEDTYPEGEGSFEIENTFSYGHRTRDDHGYNALDVEHEFEVGLSDKFDLKIPIAYHLENSNETDSIHFDSAAIQGDYYITNSYTDPIGIAVFGEVGVGEHVMTFETVLVLQKDFGPWVIAYNIGAETEISGVFEDGVDHDVEGTITNSLGVGYEIAPKLRLGVQAAGESTYADWNHYEGTTVYAGPVLNYYGGKNWWMTVAPSFLLTNQDDEPNFLLDFIVAFNF